MAKSSTPQAAAHALGRPVWAEIHLERLAHNVKCIRKLLKPETKLMAVVKADGYGHGAASIASTLLANGVDRLAVAIADEGIALRNSGIEAPILVLGVTPPEEAEKVVRHGLIPAVCTTEFLDEIERLGSIWKKQVGVHVRVDIGLGSVGVRLAESREFIRQAMRRQWIQVEGVFTHLSSAYGGDDAYLAATVAQFSHVLEDLRQEGIHVPLAHAASSPGVLRAPGAHFDMVRTGILLYGLPAVEKPPVRLDLKPVLELKAKVVFIKTLEAGSHFGYGDRSRTNTPKRIATLPIGYADGQFLFHLENGEVLLRGRRAPIIGRAFMDHLMVDVTRVPEVEIGDEAVIIGKQGVQRIRAEDVARWCGIPDLCGDLITMLGGRVPKVYVGDNGV
ncbi:alanine racemase [Paenibacillus sp. y28]|uniref:alanine racemase n=1 Tax=Paenibacillus sp. y28 TaxID=3129110 RepID=UPI003017D304